MKIYLGFPINRYRSLNDGEVLTKQSILFRLYIYPPGSQEKLVGAIHGITVTQLP